MRRQVLLSSGMHGLILALLLGGRIAPLTEPDEPASIEVIFGTGTAPATAPTMPSAAANATDSPASETGTEAHPAAPLAAPAMPSAPEPGLRPERPDPTMIPARDKAGNRGPAYPQIAWQRHQQGTVMLRLYIGTDGSVTRVETLRSSGVAALDDAAIAALSEWHFLPAQRAGQPVASYRDQPVSFIIP
jgi:protein TonB